MTDPPPLLAHVIPPTALQDYVPGWDILFNWELTNPLLLLPLTLGILYARGLRRWSRPRFFRSWAPLSFYGGLALTVAALAGPIDALADDLFSMHMVQHMVLVMIGPPLVLLGAPTTPVLKGLPRSARRGIVAPLMRSRLASGFYRYLSYPPAVLLMFTVNLWMWHFYGNAYETATQHFGVHLLEHSAFLLTAVLFWWVVIDPKPLRSRLSYPLRILFIGAAMFQEVALGAFITYRQDVLYAYYAVRPRAWGLSPLYDQQLAAMWMWIGGTLVLTIALILVLAIWLDREEKSSREREAAQDARRARPAPFA